MRKSINFTGKTLSEKKTLTPNVINGFVPKPSKAEEKELMDGFNKNLHTGLTQKEWLKKHNFRMP